MLTSQRSHRSGQRSLGAPEGARRQPQAPFRRGPIKLALIAPIVALAMGCSVVGDIDETANAVILVIGSIVPTSDPFGDVLSTSGIIPEDGIDVTFSAHLKSPIAASPIITTPELQDIVLERYEVTFQRTDGGTQVPPGFTRAMTARVRLTALGSGTLNTTTVALVIMPSTTKAQPPVSFLISPGTEPGTNYANIQVRATITFFGKTLSGDPVTATGQFGINLANFGDDNS